MDDQWTDCSTSNCCPGYTFVAGRCVPDDINPCSLNLCEQKCSVYFGRVVCTCFSGYKFNREKHLASSQTQTTQSGSVKLCEDIDDCQDNNGDCEQVEDTQQYIWLTQNSSKGGFLIFNHLNICSVSNFHRRSSNVKFGSFVFYGQCKLLWSI